MNIIPNKSVLLASLIAAAAMTTCGKKVEAQQGEPQPEVGKPVLTFNKPASIEMRYVTADGDRAQLNCGKKLVGGRVVYDSSHLEYAIVKSNGSYTEVTKVNGRLVVTEGNINKQPNGSPQPAGSSKVMEYLAINLPSSGQIPNNIRAVAAAQCGFNETAASLTDCKPTTFTYTPKLVQQIVASPDEACRTKVMNNPAIAGYIQAAGFDVQAMRVYRATASGRFDALFNTPGLAPK